MQTTKTSNKKESTNVTQKLRTNQKFTNSEGKQNTWNTGEQEVECEKTQEYNLNI